jgi:hypothetical protein
MSLRPAVLGGMITAMSKHRIAIGGAVAWPRRGGGQAAAAAQCHGDKRQRRGGERPLGSALPPEPRVTAISTT